MNKTEFIEELVKLFDDFNADNILARKRAYETVLCGGIDYDGLYKAMVKEITSFKYSPTPSALLEIVSRKRLYIESIIERLDFLETYIVNGSLTDNERKEVEEEIAILKRKKEQCQCAISQ